MKGHQRPQYLLPFPIDFPTKKMKHLSSNSTIW